MCLSLFVVNNVIFSIFFVDYGDIHEPTEIDDILASVFVVVLVPSIFYVGIKSDKMSPWRILISQYFLMILSLLIFALEGDQTWY